MPRIITAVFTEGNYKSVSGDWQWDYGEILRIQGLKLDSAVEIHFSLYERGGDSKQRIGVTKDGVTDVVSQTLCLSMRPHRITTSTLLFT